MPRGVTIPELRQQLFAATERVIVRDGPARLTGRAVTGEAGVATGLLYAHFDGFDNFLTSYAVDRAFLIAAEIANLPRRTGTGDVADNVCEAVLAVPRVALSTLARLQVLRPDLDNDVHDVLGDRAAGLDAIESTVADYLTRERELGRLVAACEPSAIALALVGLLHHVVLTAADDVPERLRPTITALVDGIRVARPVGIEPTTLGLEVPCSIR